MACTKLARRLSCAWSTPRGFELEPRAHHHLPQWEANDGLDLARTLEGGMIDSEELFFVFVAFFWPFLPLILFSLLALPQIPY